MFTEEQKKEIEDLYNYYWELYKEKEETDNKNYYAGKCSGIEDIMYRLGYKPKTTWLFVEKEKE